MVIAVRAVTSGKAAISAPAKAVPNEVMAENPCIPAMAVNALPTVSIAPVNLTPR